MTQPYLSIIIPAHNEAKRLPDTLIDINRRLAGAAYSYEIIVVNSNSQDDTVAIVNDMRATIRNLSIADSGSRQGKGAAVRHGMLLAGGQFRLFTDADNSTSIDHFDRMIPHFESGYDVVICDRTTHGALLDPPQPIYRQIPGKMGNLVIQALLTPGIWDTQCGFKAFSADAAQSIFAGNRIDGWGFDAEILALAGLMKYRIKTIPVHWVDKPDSHVLGSDYFRVLREALMVRWWIWRGVYAKAVAGATGQAPQPAARDETASVQRKRSAS